MQTGPDGLMPQEVIENRNGISLIFLSKQESPEAGAHSLGYH